MTNRPRLQSTIGLAQPHPIFSCWAKLGVNGDAPDYHPLLCHMVDVAIVALEMWKEALSPRQREGLSKGLGLGDNQDTAGGWCAFIAGLHDLGKASPAFQLQVERIRSEVRGRLRGAGLPAGQNHSPMRIPHGTITAATAPDILETGFGLDRTVAQRLGVVAGGHHGVFPTSSEVHNIGASAKGRAEWNAHRLILAKKLADALSLPRSTLPGRIDNATAMLLAGFVRVADWIGSNVDSFPYRIPDDLGEYAEYARTQAKTALDALGWLAKRGPDQTASFVDLFPGITLPNDLQRSVESVAAGMSGSGMVIIEAPMGEGKTEAAIFLADHWAAAWGQEGHYFALPTQATTNQMFSRVREFLQNRYEGERVQLQLLHGHASLSAEFEVLRQNNTTSLTPRYAGVDGHGDEIAVVASEWFTHRKRGLLAPFGVGTIDQALLAALQTRHVFVRLFGLAHRTVIVDEVHAYDSYMITLLERLLEWLAALGSSVVLLSATLPGGRREQLLAAYTRGMGGEPEVAPSVAYPRISWVSRGTEPGARTVRVSDRGRKEVSLEWTDGTLPQRDGAEFPLRELLQSALRHGGCAAIVCNTVRRAQEVYLALQSHFDGVCDDGEPELDLLHSRYPFGDRETREQRALARFGRPGDPAVKRPRRAILVATQIIEQSLDLDFDLMVSDMAPADLLLQRVGRLHRHERTRPEGLTPPRLLVCGPAMTADAPRFEPGTSAVYDSHILLRSWLALRNRDVIRVPGDVERIIETVYNDDHGPGDLPEALIEAWEQTRAALETAMARLRDEARHRWIGPPSYTGQLWRLTNNVLEEDAPEFHRAHQALTRLAAPSVSAVLLFGNAEDVALDTALNETVDMNQPPNLETTRRLLMRSVSISDRRVVSQLLEQPPPRVWRRSGLLRNHRAIFLDCLGTARIGDHLLTLNDDVGVTISRYE